jgi:hypothetical protein
MADELVASNIGTIEAIRAAHDKVIEAIRLYQRVLSIVGKDRATIDAVYAAADQRDHLVVAIRRYEHALSIALKMSSR